MSNFNTYKFSNVDEINRTKNTSGWFKKIPNSASKSKIEKDRHPILRVKDVDDLNAVSGVIRYKEEGESPVFQGFNGTEWKDFNIEKGADGKDGLNYQTIVTGSNLGNQENGNLFKTILKTEIQDEIIEPIEDMQITPIIHKLPAYKYNNVNDSQKFNLSNHNIIFEPYDNESYTVKVRENDIYPLVDYSQHQKFSVINNNKKLDDNNYFYKNLNRPFKFYDKEYKEIYVNENGYITFGSGESSYIHNILQNHFSKNRISAMFLNLEIPSEDSNTDIYIGNGKYGELVITFQNYVRNNISIGSVNINFQIRLFLNDILNDPNELYSDDYFKKGTIQISYSKNDNYIKLNPIVGLSNGEGYNANIFNSLYFTSLKNNDLWQESLGKGIPFLRTLISLEINNEESKTNLEENFESFTRIDTTNIHRLILDDMDETTTNTIYDSSYQENNFYIKLINLGNVTINKIALAIRSIYDYEEKESNKDTHYSDSTNHFIDKVGESPNINNGTLDTDWQTIPEDKFISLGILNTNSGKDFHNIYENLDTTNNLYNSKIYRIQAKYENSLKQDGITFEKVLILKIIYILNSDTDVNETNSVPDNAEELLYDKTLGGDNYGPYQYQDNGVDYYIIKRTERSNFSIRIYDYKMTNKNYNDNNETKLLTRPEINNNLTLELLNSKKEVLQINNNKDSGIEKGLIYFNELPLFNSIDLDSPGEKEIEYYIRITGEYKMGYYGISLIENKIETTPSQIEEVYTNHVLTKIHNNNFPLKLSGNSDDEFFMASSSNYIALLIPNTTTTPTPNNMELYKYSNTGKEEDKIITNIDISNGIRIPDEIQDIILFNDYTIIMYSKDESKLIIEFYNTTTPFSKIEIKDTSIFKDFFSKIVIINGESYIFIIYNANSNNTDLTIIYFKINLDDNQSTNLADPQPIKKELNIGSESYKIVNILNLNDKIFIIYTLESDTKTDTKIITIDAAWMDDAQDTTYIEKTIQNTDTIYAEKYEYGDVESSIILFYKNDGNSYFIKNLDSDLTDISSETPITETENDITYIINFKVKRDIIIVLWETVDKRNYKAYQLINNEPNKIKSKQYDSDELFEVDTQKITINGETENVFIILRNNTDAVGDFLNLSIEIEKQTNSNIIYKINSGIDYQKDLINNNNIKTIFNSDTPTNNRKFELTPNFKKMFKTLFNEIENKEQLFFVGFDNNNNLIIEGFGDLDDGIVDTGFREVSDFIFESLKDSLELYDFETGNTRQTFSFNGKQTMGGGYGGMGDMGGISTAISSATYDLYDLNTIGHNSYSDPYSDPNSDTLHNICETSMKSLKIENDYYICSLYGPIGQNYEHKINIFKEKNGNEIEFETTFYYPLLLGGDKQNNNIFDIISYTNTTKQGFIYFKIELVDTSYIKITINNIVIANNGDISQSSRVLIEKILINNYMFPSFKWELIDDDDILILSFRNDNTPKFMDFTNVPVDNNQPGANLYPNFNALVFMFIDVNELSFNTTFLNNPTNISDIEDTNFYKNIHTQIIRDQYDILTPNESNKDQYLSGIIDFKYIKQTLYFFEYFNNGEVIPTYDEQTSDEQTSDEKNENIRIIKCINSLLPTNDNINDNTIDEKYFSSVEKTTTSLDDSLSQPNSVTDFYESNRILGLNGTYGLNSFFERSLHWADTNGNIYIYFFAQFSPLFYKDDTSIKYKRNYTDDYGIIFFDSNPNDLVPPPTQAPIDPTYDISTTTQAPIDPTYDISTTTQTSVDPTYDISTTTQTPIDSVGSLPIMYSHSRIVKLKISSPSEILSGTISKAYFAEDMNFTNLEAVLGEDNTNKAKALENETLFLNNANLAQFNIIMDNDNKYIIAASHGEIVENDCVPNREKMDFIIYKIEDSGDLKLLFYGKRQKIFALNIENNELVIFSSLKSDGTFPNDTDERGEFLKVFKKSINLEATEEEEINMETTPFKEKLPYLNNENKLKYPEFFLHLGSTYKFDYNGAKSSKYVEENQEKDTNYNMIVAYSSESTNIGYSSESTNIGYNGEQKLGILNFGILPEKVIEDDDDDDDDNSIINTDVNINSKISFFNQQNGKNNISNFVVGIPKNKEFLYDDTGIIYYSYIIPLYLVNDNSNFYVRTNSIPNYEPRYSNKIIKGRWSNELNIDNKYSIEPQNYGWLNSYSVENGKYLKIPHIINNVNTKSILAGEIINETFWYISDNNWDAIMVNPGFFDSNVINNGDGTFDLNTLDDNSIHNKLLTPLGRIAVATNGVLFYNYSNIEGNTNVVEDLKGDNFGGYTDSNHCYHYHQWPVNLEGMMDLGLPNSSIDLGDTVGNDTLPKLIYGRTYYFNQIDKTNYNSNNIDKFNLKFEAIYKGTTYRYKVIVDDNTTLSLKSENLEEDENVKVLSNINPGDIIIFNHTEEIIITYNNVPIEKNYTTFKDGETKLTIPDDFDSKKVLGYKDSTNEGFYIISGLFYHFIVVDAGEDKDYFNLTYLNEIPLGDGLSSPAINNIKFGDIVFFKREIPLNIKSTNDNKADSEDVLNTQRIVQSQGTYFIPKNIFSINKTTLYYNLNSDDKVYVGGEINSAMYSRPKAYTFNNSLVKHGIPGNSYCPYTKFTIPTFSEIKINYLTLKFEDSKYKFYGILNHSYYINSPNELLDNIKLFVDTKYVITLDSSVNISPSFSINEKEYQEYTNLIVNVNTENKLMTFNVDELIPNLYLFNKDNIEGGSLYNNITGEKFYNKLKKLKITSLDTNVENVVYDNKNEILNEHILKISFEENKFIINSKLDDSYKYYEAAENKIKELKLYTGEKYKLILDKGTMVGKELKFSSNVEDLKLGEVTFNNTYDNTVKVSSDADGIITFVVEGLEESDGVKIFENLYLYDALQETIQNSFSGSIKTENIEPINTFIKIEENKYKFYDTPESLKYFKGYLDYENAGDYIYKKLEKTGPKGHSPLLGYAFDGYPIYGPIGYDIPEGDLTTTINEQTKVKLMESSYKGGLDNNNNPTYLQGSGDLDICNGILSKTPEYPNGIFHYVCTIEKDTNNLSKKSVSNTYGYLNIKTDIVKSSYPYIIGAYKAIPEKSNFDTISKPITSTPESLETQITTYNINFRSLKSINNKFNGIENNSIVITQDDNYLNLRPTPHPYIWNFTNNKTNDSFFGEDNEIYSNNISQLKSSIDDVKFKAYGSVSKFLSRDSIKKGMAVCFSNEDGKLFVKLYNTDIDTDTDILEKNGIAFLGIALNDAEYNEEDKIEKPCYICNRGITTVKLANESTNYNCGSYGILNFSTTKGCIFNPGTNDIISNVPIAGYFLEDNNSGTNQEYVLFYVQSSFEFN